MKAEHLNMVIYNTSDVNTTASAWLLDFIKQQNMSRWFVVMVYFIPARVTTSVISKPFEPKNLSSLSKSKLVSGKLNLTTLALDTRPSSRPVGILTFGPPTYTNYKFITLQTMISNHRSSQTKVLKTFVNILVANNNMDCIVASFFKPVCTYLPNLINL